MKYGVQSVSDIFKKATVSVLPIYNFSSCWRFTKGASNLTGSSNWAVIITYGISSWKAGWNG